MPIIIMMKEFSVYGAGADIDEAIEDANERLTYPIDADKFYLLPSIDEARGEDMCWAYCTDRLVKALHENIAIPRKVAGIRSGVSILDTRKE